MPAHVVVPSGNETLISCIINFWKPSSSSVISVTGIMWVINTLFYDNWILLNLSCLSKQLCWINQSLNFSCDQAALWMVFSVRLSVRPSVCPSVRPSVCPSVRLSHLFDYVPISVSSWNFQELSPRTRVWSMQKVKVRGQRSRSQRSRPNLTVSGL